jgi:thiol-disulfide isomerase/thioredoxin
MYRRLTIIVVIVAVVLLLVVGFYYAYTAANQNGSKVNVLVSQQDFTTLRQLSLAPYGGSDSSFLSYVKVPPAQFSPFTSNGKPLIVYIGADYCPFCSIQRWPLIMALMRFGNFTGLKYMASSPSEGDYATFTFHQTTYTSQYIVFQGFEQEDRSANALDTVPANYTSIFSNYGSSYPFIDFGNRWIIPGAMIQPESLGNDNWNDVFNAIGTNSSLGTQIKESANVITALICKLSSNVPGSVCNQPQITELTISIAAYDPGSVGIAPSYLQAGLIVAPAEYLARHG